MNPIETSILSKIIKSLEDKKALNIKVLDIRENASYTDYLVLCSGTSSTHVAALVSNVEDSFPKKEKPVYRNKSKDDSWCVLDFVDVVVHVFKEETRDYYDLDGLWNDAKRLEV